MDIENNSDSKSMDITELICHLQQEKLLVDTERSNLEILNEELADHTNKLIKATWINAQQRVNLNNLVARPDYTPEQCYRRSVALANCTFVQAKDIYDYQTLSNFSQFISLLRKRTEQLAQWIVIGERLSKDTQLFCQILQTIIAGLYGSLLLPEDINMLLNLLRYLARFQLVTTDNPRRKLSQGSCAFSKMYLLFHESLPSAKLFLIAALQCPIIQLIANTNECLDLDPDKTIQRLSVVDRFDRFGPQGTSEYDIKVSEFHKHILDQLTTFTHSFISSIQENIYCFPTTLASLIKHIIQMIAQSFGEHSKEVNEISTDLIFTLYICPAIVNPEPYGVCDAPISPTARHNLIQVSQLLQRLALVRPKTGDDARATNDANTNAALEDDKVGGVQRLLLQRCEGGAGIADVVNVLLSEGDEGEDAITDEPLRNNVIGVQREFIVATEYELNSLMSFLVKAHNTTLEDLGGMNETASSASDMQQQQLPDCTVLGGDSRSGCGTSASDVDNDQFVALLTKLPAMEVGGGGGGSSGSGSSPRHSSNVHSQVNGGGGVVGEMGVGCSAVCGGGGGGGGAGRGGGGARRQTVGSKATVHKPSAPQQQQPHLRTSSSSDSTSDEPAQPLSALLIPLHADRPLIGLLPEHQVLLMSTRTATGPLTAPECSTAVGLEPRADKRVRCGDEGSIGNTSDNLEAISEGASNHSVASSMEMEDRDGDDDDDDIGDGHNDGDNLSDMVSANVSGRGSPNISGRDTPSSQVTENEDRIAVVGAAAGNMDANAIAGELRAPYNTSQQHALSAKHSVALRHSDIDDKFCKFEIKRQLLPATADETVSIISDTWSTDVLASDSETVDIGADLTNNTAATRHFSPIVEQPITAAAAVGLLDVSETQSESAWSTDVLVASDTERLTEVDNDDLASVAPSDDTASVAPSEPDDGSVQNQLLNDRKLSTASTTNYSTISGYEYAQQLDHVTSGQDASLSNQKNDSSAHMLPNAVKMATGQRLPVLPHVPIAVTDVPPSDTVSATTYLLVGINKADDVSVIKNTPAHLLAKNISAQKYNATADSQLSNTSLNSSSSGSSSGLSERQGKTVPFIGGKAENHGKRKQKRGDKSGTLFEHVSTDGLVLINTLGDSTIDSGGNKTLSNGSAVNINDNCNRCGNMKPTVATGAIPKSISFDISAEKGDKDYDEQKGRRNASGIFGKFRLNLRTRRGKSELASVATDRSRAFTEHTVTAAQTNTDISEDILAKYRRNGGNSTAHSKRNDGARAGKALTLDDNDNQLVHVEADADSVQCAFEDAKKKLRIILSNSKSHNTLRHGRTHTKQDLATFLRLEMAKAMHFRQWQVAARISETLRCIQLLDAVHFHKLCATLRSDCGSRAVYTQYLLHSRQLLLCSHSFLEELTEQVDREAELCGASLVSVCVRLYLDGHNAVVQEFSGEFRRLTLVDEKYDLLCAFLKRLYSHMRKDSIWQDATSSQIEQTQVAIERSVMARVYLHALHPHGDVDRERDRMLNEHLAKLGRSLTPDHKDLQIAPCFRREAPWLPAQQALRSLAAYRSARDKVRCVSHCAAAIMALLSLGQSRGGSTAADDFVPVLVYVIIKANPRDLLSTVQYVKSFYGGQLCGEEEYWWTQFCSAVEFTKTMD